MRDNWYKSDLEKTRLDQAGVDESVVDAAVGAFILEAIAKHGHPTKVLCNKDPLTLKHGAYMTQLFPKSKWLFMIRDGRAVVHSVVTRKVTITGYQLDNPRQCLEKWNTVITNMDKQCQEIGPERCMVVYYEQLVLHPERWMTIILDFLDLPWDSSVLHHQDFINKKGDSGIRVSMKERSSDQIVKPINIEALTQWVGFYSQDVLNDMAEIAPMLSTFGYDPELNPPNYGQPDGQVVNNTNEVQKNKDFWEIRAKQLVAQMEKRD
ncbi:protein-tyrosine sulfotransferase [Eurytemora carolleeae]|uniref:protein-tyrosine sulfotransferase n=1 Tax=Eurytemora carolleeae TaxID=1294199 RepID=UPI000C77C3C0|nr:protein-tyrosine sulfotransferase [Eurytemora carolleeae]|eukprot:XP_023328323.1 protein-tyrosine sulfotransferase-like [Eurytemora affinis]